MGREQRRQQGYSLIEVLLTFAILAVATTALGLVEISNARRTQDLKARDIGFARAQAFMERILRLPFGTPNFPASDEYVPPADETRMQASDYDRLFGSDDDVSALCLTQLEQIGHTQIAPNKWRVIQPPIRFTLEGVEDAGEWEVFVDQDLDGNGIVESDIGGVATREGLNDVLRVEIRRNGKTLLRTIRTRPPDGATAGGA